MIPEFGHFALILAQCFAMLLAAAPLFAVWLGDDEIAMSLAQPFAAGLLAFAAIAFACLAYSFLADDFSVKLVAAHSNTLLPSAFKFSAVWGNHEGSLLLWILILALWTGAVARFTPALPQGLRARALAVMGFIAAGFLLFSLALSNPFERILPIAPQEGGDLNPLLQDPGLIIHPPLLYTGYVGFSVAFAFAIAALMEGRLDAEWARWARPWTNAAWAFLTLGIMLGSWWAYYELGWGGWWFWDPVENASFMPWLAGAALVHSLSATEKRGLFRSWTALLAIFAFSLCLLGAFLVRSGVLSSVHAFATDPARGVFILGFLAVVVGGSLTLYAWRAPMLFASRARGDGAALRAGEGSAPRGSAQPASKAASGGADFGLASRESLLLLNNVVFLVAALTVLFGTLFPLLADALELGKYSVGPPYFNAVFLPLMAVLLPFMGIAPAARWRRDAPARWLAELAAPALAALALGAMFPFLYRGAFNPWACLGVALAAWLTLAMLRDLRERVFVGVGAGIAAGAGSGIDGAGTDGGGTGADAGTDAADIESGTRAPGEWRRRLRALGPRYWGMQLGHLGFAAAALGVTLSSQYAAERDVKMTVGDRFEVAGYHFHFAALAPAQGPNFTGDEGRFEVYRRPGGPVIAALHPQKRRYLASGQVMTEAAIDPGLFRDLFVALGEPLDDGAWAVRLHYKPFVRWIWGGAILMALGGFAALLDRRQSRSAAPPTRRPAQPLGSQPASSSSRRSAASPRRRP